MALIVGVDPGGKSGLCEWRSSWPKPHLAELSPDDTMKFLRAQAVHNYDVTFVVETYTITAASAKMTQQTDALELIGVVKFLCQQYDHQYVLQKPSEAKKFSTDAKLKKLGWYDASLGQGFEGHARDASRHVLLYAAKSGLLDLAQLIGGS